ncbi:hypothetical protein PMZ80_009473 [Knufia obscura]|uniref:Auxin efflux carrier n=2 Tax=Knufia TaxID=430999 RepID=A0AAN8E9A3_9EURO|nr:hypothetical protein PMZ80_009473 [Knufia obscura]KAK5949589.1 hypothetical protein OHC33_009396 [Knufia fluminis]
MPLSDYFRTPTSFRLSQLSTAIEGRDQHALSTSFQAIEAFTAPYHSAHPNFGHLMLLVFEAVLEVVCVSAPGYIVARQGMFDAEAQKFLANLNVQLFTPALIFTKLASQLTADKLADLAIIPLIFVVQTLISFGTSFIISKLMRLKKRHTNFVIAMAVFGNSNSLPISLVISLSKTLKGLHWDKVPGDNDDEVGARGILYLLIFQQLGQLVRWTWGYNVLLAPAEKYTEEEGGTMHISETERGRGEYRDEPETERLISPLGTDQDYSDDDDSTRVANSPTTTSGAKTPNGHGKFSSRSSESDADLMPTPANGNIAPDHNLVGDGVQKGNEHVGPVSGTMNKIRNGFIEAGRKTKRGFRSAASSMFAALPGSLQKVLTKLGSYVSRFFAGLWEFMNPPLWAMLIAILVASVPPLQHLFFDKGTFLRNSVTRAVEQSGNVAVPLILVVLGGNLARNTLPRESAGDITDPKVERKLLIASLVSRMLLPTIVMAPLLALTAKFIPVSILDDKIFIIVCFLLTGAPTALQLAQICQINNVFMPVMSNILFQSYVIWILPSTLILVLLALETVEWAKA